MKSLTAPERETVINWSDADDSAHIWTAQRPIITKLRANPAAEEVASGRYGSTYWAEFRFPARLVSFRKPRVTTLKTDRVIDRKRAAANLVKARAAKKRSDAVGSPKEATR